MVRCLNSVSWCAERVVVDSGSTDGTRKISESMGARFHVHIQSGPFNIAEQRNWALECAGIESDWVLFLDADEEVTTALKTEIERLISAGLGEDAYELTPRYLFWGLWLRRTQGYPNWHARLVRRGHVRFSGGVWEHFDDRAKVGRIHTPYNHYANSKGLSDWLARHDRYSSWDAHRILEYLETKDPRSLGTTRKVALRAWAARFYYLRPIVRFVHLYIIRLGFLEKLPAFVFCWLYFFYESMTVIKIIELKRKRNNMEL